MTDRELLELAAKAAGVKINLARTREREEAGYGHLGLWTNTTTNWNPLTDDGDALRLAVKLHIDVRHFMYERGEMDCIVDRIGRAFRESFTDDPAAATRRAIVRAAAALATKEA